MINFLWQAIQITLIQIVSVLGTFFVIGFILAEVQKATLLNYSRSVGWHGILWTAWLGTPVHEYGHAFFALLFRHKINSIALFHPNEKTGELGHVNHSYNPKNLYQSIGNFFIGLAPMIFGPLILVLILVLLVPSGSLILTHLSAGHASLPVLWENIRQSLALLLSPDNLRHWTFWIFLYISFCIASHLAPSHADRRGAWKGGWVIALILLIVNILALLLHHDLTGYILDFSHLLGGLITVYIYALLLSLIHFILSFLVLLPWRRKVRL